MTLLRPSAPIVGAVLLVALALGSLLIMPDIEFRDASFRSLRTVILEPLILIPVLRWSIRRNEIAIVLSGLAAMIALTTIWAVVQVVTGGGVATAGLLRATGPYRHPNNLAFFLERSTLLVAVPAILTPRFRRIGWALAVIGSFGVLITFSRGALIGLPVAIALIFWITGRLRAIAGVVAGCIVLGATLALFAGNRLLDSGSQGGEPSRLVLWRASLRMLQDFPFRGIGLDQFYIMYGLRYISPEGWPERYTSHPHNIVLDFWLSLGVGGLLLLIVGLLWGYLAISRLRKNNGRGLHFALAAGGAAALTAGVVHGLVDNAFFLPDLAVLTWIGVILLAEADTGSVERE